MTFNESSLEKGWWTCMMAAKGSYFLTFTLMKCTKTQLPGIPVLRQTLLIKQDFLPSHSLPQLIGQIIPPNSGFARSSPNVFSPPDRKGLLDFMLESAFAMLLHHAPTQYPARAARQRIPPSIPPEQWIPPSVAPELLARAARKWIPPSIPPELLASGSRPVSRQSCSPVDVSRQSGSPVDPAEYPAELMGIWSRSP